MICFHLFDSEYQYNIVSPFELKIFHRITNKKDMPAMRQLLNRLDSVFTYRDFLYDNYMEPIVIFKALSSESRLQFSQWLKEPERHFMPHEEIDLRKTGVWVNRITQRLNMTQSTASQYFSICENEGIF
jgi:ArsR family transcriptional regulator